MGVKYFGWSCKNKEKDGETDSNHVQGFDCSWTYEGRKIHLPEENNGISKLTQNTHWSCLEFWPNSTFVHYRWKEDMFEGATSIPVELKWKRKSKQITETFTDLASGKYLPMQLIYGAKTERSHKQGITFWSEIDVTHSENLWSNEIVALSAPYWSHYPICEKTAWGTRTIGWL